MTAAAAPATLGGDDKLVAARAALAGHDYGIRPEILVRALDALAEWREPEHLDVAALKVVGLHLSDALQLVLKDLTLPRSLLQLAEWAPKPKPVPSPRFVELRTAYEQALAAVTGNLHDSAADRLEAREQRAWDALTEYASENGVCYRCGLPDDTENRSPYCTKCDPRGAAERAAADANGAGR